MAAALWAMQRPGYCEETRLNENRGKWYPPRWSISCMFRASERPAGLVFCGKPAHRSPWIPDSPAAFLESVKS